MSNHGQLGKTLWNIASKLRGSMDANDFKDYMLSFLFLRHLSDNFETAAKKELGSDYPQLPAGDKRTPLVVFYQHLSETEVAEFEKLMNQRLHYVIEPKFLWSAIAEKARTQDADLLSTLDEAFHYIENKSFDSAFQGLFSEINLSSDKLGKTYKDRNDLLCRVVQKISEGISQFSTDADSLGDAYEYLIGQFAAGAGKKAGEFYTPQFISTILSRIVILDSQDPSAGPRKKMDKVLDFTCGSGSLLLNVRKRSKDNGGTINKIYGQEKNGTTYNLARMNMLLHGVKDTEFQIHRGDTLTNDWDNFNELNPSKKLEFDGIVANPPFSLRWEPTEAMGTDFRFKDYGLAPKTAADYAFLLHGFHFLAKEGTMAIILPHGVLFRGGAEERIRTKLLKDGNIDTVIGLPEKLFYSTTIPVCILILKKCKKSDDVLFINASEHYEKVKKQNVLLEEHLEKIIATYTHRTTEDKYSRAVPMAEIEANEYNLNISRYVNTTTAEAEIDLLEVHTKIKTLEAQAKSATDEHNKFLAELGLPLL